MCVLIIFLTISTTLSPPLATEAVARGEAGKGAAIRRNMRRVRKGEAS